MVLLRGTEEALGLFVRKCLFPYELKQGENLKSRSRLDFGFARLRPNDRLPIECDPFGLNRCPLRQRGTTGKEPRFFDNLIPVWVLSVR